MARLPLVKLADLDRTEAWFARHGAKAVFLGRMVPIFRSLISVPAGVERMRMTVFLLYTALGSLLWNTAFVLAGYGLGDNWRTVEEYVGVYSRPRSPWRRGGARVRGRPYREGAHARPRTAAGRPSGGDTRVRT